MKDLIGYKSETQNKNIAWYLPRPKKDKYKGGMPLYAEDWLINLSKDILGFEPEVLNVFCGMNKKGLRVDIKTEVKPDIVADVHKLSNVITNKKFDVILADPPYSTQESKELYNTPKLNYKKWTSECEKLLNPSGLLIIYHKYIVPNPNPTIFKIVKRVFIGNRTWHLPRVAIYFQKSNILENRIERENKLKEGMIF